MSNGRNIIVIGSSAGSMEALRDICGSLPGDLRAAVFVVVHTGPSSPRVMPQVLDRPGGLLTDYARDMETIQMGRIYIAAPDRHMLLTARHIEVTAGPKENGFRPAIDPLFRSAARAFGRQVIGVVLSGGMDDGSEGLRDIKLAGGVAVVQDPEEAMFRSMPMNAILHAPVDHVLRSTQIAAALVELVSQPLVRTRTRMKSTKQPRSPEPAESGEAALHNHAPRFPVGPDLSGMWRGAVGNPRPQPGEVPLPRWSRVHRAGDGHQS
jgi:two-component system chemotaxis response regulator CheB